MRNETRGGETACSAGLTLEDGWYKYLLLEKNNAGTLRVVETISERAGETGDSLYEGVFSSLGASSAPKEIPIVFALRFNESLIKIIDMQRLSLEEVRSTLRYQFEDYFPFALRESNYRVQEIDFRSLGAVEKRFVAAACRTRIVREIKAGAEKSGFRLSCVEPSQIAFERAVTPEGCKESLIQIYAGKSDLLFIFSNGKNGIFYRNAVIRAEGSEYIDRAAKEAKVSLDFALHHISDFNAGRVIVAGPNAGKVLSCAVAKALRCGSVENVNFISGYGAALGQPADAGMILPFGAAMRQL